MRWLLGALVRVMHQIYMRKRGHHVGFSWGLSYDAFMHSCIHAPLFARRLAVLTYPKQRGTRVFRPHHPPLVPRLLNISNTPVPYSVPYTTVYRTVPCVGSCVEFSVPFRSVALQVHPPQPVPDVDRLPVPAGLSLREAADVREAQHGHLVPHLLLPAGELPAVPCGARVEAAVLAVPQEVHDVVPGARMCVWCVSALAGRPMKNVCVSSVYSDGRKEGTKEGRTGWCV